MCSESDLVKVWSYFVTFEPLSWTQQIIFNAQPVIIGSGINERSHNISYKPFNTFQTQKIQTKPMPHHAQILPISFR